MSTIKVPCRVVIREMVGHKSHLDIVINGTIAAVVEYDLETGKAEVFDMDHVAGRETKPLFAPETKQI